MTHGRKPRRPRPITRNPFLHARDHATRLTIAEVNQVMNPLRAAATALRCGVATEYEWMVAVSAVNLADSIESQGIVRGMAGHLRDIDMALQAIRRRAMDDHVWRAPALDYEERDLLDLLIDLHGHQVRSLSYGEYCRAYDKAVAQTLSAGGRLIPPSNQEQAA